MGNLGKKALMNFAVPVATNVLPKLAKATSSVLAKQEKDWHFSFQMKLWMILLKS